MSGITTPVCQHGWPLFDQDPCPDCLRAAETITAPVSDDDPFLSLPEFLRRDPDARTDPGDRLTGAQTLAGGSEPGPTAPLSPLPSDDFYDGPGSVARRLGAPEHAADVIARAEILKVQQAHKVVSAEKRLRKAGFIKGPPEKLGAYGIDRKPWDN